MTDDYVGPFTMGGIPAGADEEIVFRIVCSECGKQLMEAGRARGDTSPVEVFTREFAVSCKTCWSQKRWAR
jgi:hypothetical protein